MKLGTVLKKWRVVNEFSIKQVAAEIGVVPSTVYNLESGKPIDAATQLKLINWLFTDEAKGEK